MSLESQRRITVNIAWAGLGSISGAWANRTGGKGTSENTKVAPGGMENEIALGGRQTLDDVELVRPFFRERDRPLVGALYDARGKARVTVTDQFLDQDRNAYGAPLVWSGLLTDVEVPDAQASSSDPAMITLTVSTDGFSG